MRDERDPDRVIEALRTVLLADPDLRVGQAIALATSRALGHFDPFSIEDRDLARSLERIARERPPRADP